MRIKLPVALIVAYMCVGAAAFAATGGTGMTPNKPRQGTGDGTHSHAFPVPGKHTYGDGFGAGRGHTGQDILSDCGNNLVAAGDGKIVASGNAGDMGNYLVLSDKDEGQTYVYMHLQDVGKVSDGDRVSSGEKIGRVGDTGNATACHLHFEIWDGNWQRGKVIDPTPTLKKWDRFS